MTQHACPYSQASEDVLRRVTRQRNCSASQKERCIRFAGVLLGTLGHIGPNGRGKSRAHGHQPCLVEFAFPNREYAGRQIHIGQRKGKRLTNAQSRSVQQQDEHAASVGLQFAARAFTDYAGVEQSLQFLMGEDVGDKLRWFRNDLGKRTTAGVSASHCKTIEATEHLVFAVPKARDWACAGEVGVYTVSRNIGYGDVAHGSTKRSQGAGFGVKPHAHSLFIRNVVGGERRQVHRRPPRSKFATSRNPTRSTLA